MLLRSSVRSLATRKSRNQSQSNRSRGADTNKSVKIAPKSNPGKKNVSYDYSSPVVIMQRPAPVTESKSKSSVKKEEPEEEAKNASFHICKLCKEMISGLQDFQKHTLKKKCSKCRTVLSCDGLARIHEAYHRRHPEKPKRTAASKNLVGSKVCQFCNHPFNSDKKHFGRIESTCSNCRKKFECGGLCLQHKSQCNLVECKICSKTFFSESSLQIHARQRRCPKCMFASECFVQFVQHQCSEAEMKVEQPKEEPKVSKEEVDMENYVEDEEISDHQKPQVEALLLKKCHFCSMLCTTEDIFANHVQSTECPRCGIEQPCNALLAQHMDTCSDDRRSEIRCPECNKKMKSRRKLESHKRRRHWRPQLLDKRILELLEQRRGGEVQGQVFGVVVKNDPDDVITIE
ncbi:zinc finger protein 69-like [Neocloeon triangulifer]|uniref:zinc finger protein 69-like n=1 Tax=Neocloeon triangulifer TaxID=2078957 RepID=UPI00286EFA87|nr:zinc finger protein 69-like [Neocloeon triangulifer]